MGQLIEVPNHGVVEFPDGMSEADIVKAIKKNSLSYKKPKSGVVDGAIDFAKGAVSGAADIGNTLINASTFIPRKLSSLAGDDTLENLNNARESSLDSYNKSNQSIPFTAGRIGSNIAGTAGVGGVLAKGASAIPQIAKYAPALQSAGFNLGTAATGSKLANAGIRAGAGAINGGLSSALIDPESAGLGAGIGAAAPGALKVAGVGGRYINNKLDDISTGLMQSALKPTLKQLQSGDAAIAVRTLLDEGINPTMRGVEKIGTRIDDINDAITTTIGTSNASISKQRVLDTLNDTRGRFANQVDPLPDLDAIQGVADRFNIHPMISGDEIPVQLAQDLKKGTYKALSGKYGEVGSASTEAQKALARGLKEGIADKVPEVAGLNARESRLLTTLKVTERRALMEANKNPGGLSLLASNPATWALFMADKSALFKSLAARMVNRTAETLNRIPANGLLSNQMQQYGLLNAPSSVAVSNRR
jgi:hypothetical protein